MKILDIMNRTSVSVTPEPFGHNLHRITLAFEPQGGADEYPLPGGWDQYQLLLKKLGGGQIFVPNSKLTEKLKEIQTCITTTDPGRIISAKPYFDSVSLAQGLTLIHHLEIKYRSEAWLCVTDRITKDSVIYPRELIQDDLRPEKDLATEQWIFAEPKLDGYVILNIYRGICVMKMRYWLAQDISAPFATNLIGIDE